MVVNPGSLLAKIPGYPPSARLAHREGRRIGRLNLTSRVGASDEIVIRPNIEEMDELPARLASERVARTFHV